MDDPARAVVRDRPGGLLEGVVAHRVHRPKRPKIVERAFFDSGGSE